MYIRLKYTRSTRSHHYSPLNPQIHDSIIIQERRIQSIEFDQVAKTLSLSFSLSSLRHESLNTSTLKTVGFHQKAFLVRGIPLSMDESLKLDSDLSMWPHDGGLGSRKLRAEDPFLADRKLAGRGELLSSLEIYPC